VAELFDHLVVGLNTIHGGLLLRSLEPFISNNNYLDGKVNRMSRDSRDGLMAALGRAVRANQASVDAFDEATAQKFGVNRTDLRCLDLLMQELDGEATPGQLGSRLGLTTGSVTAMIDRLAKLGYVTRSPDPSDRRKVVVRPTASILDKSREIYGPIVADGMRLLAKYTDEELELLIDFQVRSRALQEEQLKRLRD
jgi:DNA-binding MarR family transcriptional regulator